MDETIAALFGEEAAPWIIYGLIVLAIIIAFYLLRGLWRMIRGGTYINGGHKRAPRLAILDATPIDNRRRLVLVRRDNIEHLVLIGGMNDLVIESDIGAEQKTHAATAEHPALVTPLSATVKSEIMPAAKSKPEAKPVVEPQSKKQDSTTTAAAGASGGAILGAASAQLSKASDRMEPLAENAATSIDNKVENVVSDVTNSSQGDELTASIDDLMDDTDFIEVATAEESAAKVEVPIVTSEEATASRTLAPEVSVSETQKANNIEDEMEKLLNQLNPKA